MTGPATRINPNPREEVRTICQACNAEIHTDREIDRGCLCDTCERQINADLEAMARHYGAGRAA